MRQKDENQVNAMTGNDRPAAMRASDADRDAVVSDLSEHFQAGRLTADELGERTGRALAARTWGDLGELVADLPDARPAAATSSSARLRPPSRRVAPPAIAALVGIGIAAVVLVNAANAGWGLIWLLLPALLIVRRLTCGPGTSRRCGQQD
jgi:hypothetical protein